ncbi:MAG: AAA family ATPase [Acholeplasmatales bacterium]|nr:MAG: AAA family ATPase [Acholeplasmatales bacterium]
MLIEKHAIVQTDEPLFEDIIGLEEEIEELKTIVDILASPEAYAKQGVSLPKGILMHGYPGTGKTLMVRALANEMKIPFYPIVAGGVKHPEKKGVTQSLQDIFERASAHAPSVILIDELDSFLEQSGVVRRNDVLLNQLLTLMDGFYQNKHVIVIATTNDIRSIPHALLRPGRFDRKIKFDLPSQRQRESALKYFLRYADKEKTLSLERVAYMLECTTVAEIKHVVNESILAAMKRKTPVSEEALLDAYDRYQLGITKKEETRTAAQIKRIAIHEVGHAMVHHKLGCMGTIARISIARKTDVGGHVRTVNHRYDEFTQTDLRHKIATLLAGYAAELEFYGETATGTAHDIDMATAIARDMVLVLGMSSLGPRKYRMSEGFESERHASHIEAQIDQAIQDILEAALKEAKAIVRKYRDLIEQVSDVLVAKKVLTNQDFLMLIEEVSTE